MKSNNQILERYNPAKEDKRKVSKIKSPTGPLIQIRPGTWVQVKRGDTPERIEKRKTNGRKMVEKSLTVEKNPIYKNYKGKDE